MKHYKTGLDLAKEMNVSPDVIQKTFTDYNGYAKNGNDPWFLKLIINIYYWYVSLNENLIISLCFLMSSSVCWRPPPRYFIY